MDKQKQIEEIVKLDIEESVSGYSAFVNDMRISKSKPLSISKTIMSFDCPKKDILSAIGIPEGAVVLTDKKDIQQFEWSKMLDRMGIFKLVDKTRKETAEKFAEKVHNLFNRDIKDSVVYTQEEKDILKDFVESIDEICKELIGDK